MSKRQYLIPCPECDKKCFSSGYGRHMAMHRDAARRDAERAKQWEPKAEEPK